MKGYFLLCNTMNKPYPKECQIISKDKENAFVFESGNLESLIETIKTALESDCEVIKKNARKTALEYSNQNSDSILEDIFEGFLNC